MIGDQPSWEETVPYDSLFNFKWQPWSNGLKYDYLSKYGSKQLVNHIEGHEGITTKDSLFLNLRTYFEKSNTNVFDVVPLTFILDFKSDFIYEQIDIFRGVHKIIETNIAADISELNKKIQQFQTVNERKGHMVKNAYKLLPSSHDH